MTDESDRRESEGQDHTQQPRRAPNVRPLDGFADRALGAKARVVEENGRWVVYLNVDFWEPHQCANSSDDEATDTNNSESNAGADSWPIQSYGKRIADYPDRQRAEVAAKWIERSADRHLQRPPSGL